VVKTTYSYINNALTGNPSEPYRLSGSDGVQLRRVSLFKAMKI